MEKYKLEQLAVRVCLFHWTSFIIRYFCINFCLTCQFLCIKSILHEYEYKYKESSFFFSTSTRLQTTRYSNNNPFAYGEGNSNGYK